MGKSVYFIFSNVHHPEHVTVQFDPFMCTVDGEHEVNGLGTLDIGSDDEKSSHTGGVFQNGQDSNAPTPGSGGVCYRIGSVGHDTQLCLWDITEDMLKPANVQRHRNSTIIAPMLGLEIQTSSSRLDPLCEASPAQSVDSAKPKKKRGFHRRGFTLGRLGGSSSDRRRLESPASLSSAALDEARLLGTRVCPRMEDVPVI
ncbi:hypothetical protein ANCDUO_09900, partial [Ancylostoma duodenale]